MSIQGVSIGKHQSPPDRFSDDLAVGNGWCFHRTFRKACADLGNLSPCASPSPEPWRHIRNLGKCFENADIPCWHPFSQFSPSMLNPNRRPGRNRSISQHDFVPSIEPVPFHIHPFPSQSLGMDIEPEAHQADLESVCVCELHRRVAWEASGRWGIFLRIHRLGSDSQSKSVRRSTW